MLGQALLARRMGKRRLVAETGAGQHGVATATAAALLGFDCTVYMGEVDMARQELNVFRMRLLGAEVKPASSGSRTLKDAVNEAMRDWVATVEDSHYCLGSVMGPHPYPWMVREFHRVIGTETAAQCRVVLADGTGKPDVVVACVGGGSNAAGIFSGFAEDPEVELVGVEPAGGSAVGHGVPGIVHGMKSYLLQDEFGQVLEAQSISAGLDYPGVGPEHAHLAATGRARYEPVTDAEVLEGFELLSRTEGIIPALEAAHAIAWVWRERQSLADKTVLVNLSGRGDKDVAQMMDLLAPGPHDACDCGDRRTGGRAASPARGRGQSPRPLRDRRVRGMGADRRGHRRRGRGRHRGRHPVQRSGDGRPGHPGGVPAGARAGATPVSIIDRLADVDVPVPLAVMTYYNLVYRFGFERFAATMSDSGVGAAILPDLPLDEAGPWAAAADAAGVETVMLAAPTTPTERLERIVARARVRLRRRPAGHHRRARALAASAAVIARGSRR